MGVSRPYHNNAAFRAAVSAGNWLLARKPRFVVIGTPRAGTTYFCELCRANGVVCSHESYFTEEGPVLRNPRRRFNAIGDVSWLAPPYLPDDDLIVVHQVRHPLKVIRSIFEMGFFDPRREHTRKQRVALTRKHFSFSRRPLRSALRFYIEWNERCEAITDKRFRIEDLDKEREKVGSWLGIELTNTAAVSKSTNHRTPEIWEPWDELRLRELPDFPALETIARRYGYEL